MPICPDCDLAYEVQKPVHDLFCEAKNCVICLTPYPKPLPLLGDQRVCSDCARESDLEEFMTESEDSEIGEDDDGVGEA